MRNLGRVENGLGRAHCSLIVSVYEGSSRLTGSRSRNVVVARTEQRNNNNNVDLDVTFPSYMENEVYKTSSHKTSVYNKEARSQQVDQL